MNMQQQETVPPSDFWAWVDNGDFARLGAWMGAAGVGQQEMGDMLFAQARQAIGWQRFPAARAILEYLLTVLDQPAQAPVIKLIGDLYAVEMRFAEARKWYDKLPRTGSAVELYLRTFLMEQDPAGLLRAQDEIGAGSGPELAALVDNIVDGIFRDLQGQGAQQQAHREQFAGNCTFLQALDPSAHARLVELQAALGDELFTGVLGWQGSIFRRVAGKWRQEEGCASGALATAWNAMFQDGAAKPIVRLTCSRHLQQLVRAVATEQPTYFKKGFFVVVNFQALAQFLTIVDIGAMRSSDFVFRFLDEPWLESGLVGVLVQEGWTFPSLPVLLSPSDEWFVLNRLGPILKRIGQETLARADVCTKGLEAMYPANFAASLPEKIRQQSLRIMLITTRYSTYVQHCSRDMAMGFQQLGHETFVLMENENAPAGIRMDIAKKGIHEFRPDLIFCIDHLRYEFSWVPRAIPFITWVQDPLDNIFHLNDPSCLGPLDYVYSVSSLWARALGQHPAFQRCKVRVLPILLNAEVYFPVASVKKYAVSYVAHLHLPDECAAAFSETPGHALSEKELLHRYFVRFTDGYSLRELTHYHVHRQSLGNEFVQRFRQYLQEEGGPQAQPFDPALLERFLDRKYLLTTLVTVILRCRILKPLVDDGIALSCFGKGWDRHPWFRHAACGEVSNGHDLNMVANESAINLNVSPYMSFHPRTLELAGAGAFFLTREIGPDDALPIDTFFARDREVVLFQDDKTFVDKVHYFLQHPEERETIASRARTKALQEFTFQGGAERILREMTSDLQAPRNKKRRGQLKERRQCKHK